MKKILNNLDPKAYDKLKEVIKRQTNFNNLNAENITIKKEAIGMLISWLEEVYNIDHRIEEDLSEMNIDDLFKDAQ